MFTTNSLENKLIELQNKIEALEIQNEALNREIQTLLSQEAVTEEQISHFVSNSNNFTTHNWQELLKEKQRLDDNLKKELDSIISPLKKKKAYQERNIQAHWLFVR